MFEKCVREKEKVKAISCVIRTPAKLQNHLPKDGVYSSYVGDAISSLFRPATTTYQDFI